MWNLKVKMTEHIMIEKYAILRFWQTWTACACSFNKEWIVYGNQRNIGKNPIEIKREVCSPLKIMHKNNSPQRHTWLSSRRFGKAPKCTWKLSAKVSVGDQHRNLYASLWSLCSQTGTATCCRAGKDRCSEGCHICSFHSSFFF